MSDAGRFRNAQSEMVSRSIDITEVKKGTIMGNMANQLISHPYSNL
jgi:hypothetical protein